MAVNKKIRSASAVYSFHDDDQRLDGLFFGQETPLKSSRISGLFYGRDNPISVDSDIGKARYWYQHNPYVRTIIHLEAAFFNYGFKFNEAVPAVKTWLDKKVGAGKMQRTNRQLAAAFAARFWPEWRTVDAAVAVWMTSAARPRLLPPEFCTYRDVFGIEQLSFKPEELGISKDAIKKLDGLTDGEKTLLRQDELVLNRSSRLFDFEVLKRGLPGTGFERPGLKTLLSACAQHESMEVRDNVLAGAGRNVIEHIKQGHDIKSGPHAGAKAHFNTEAKSKATANAIKNKTGHFRFVSNFDVDFSWPGPDVNNYTAKKYEGTEFRFRQWAGPLGQMLGAPSLNPVHLLMLRTQALAERDLVRDYLQTLFMRCFNAPSELKVGWGERCFLDPRSAQDVIKFGLGGGAVSQKTFLHNMDLDQDIEWSHKDEEKKQPKHRVQPAYDPHHGDPEKTPGRKLGTPDGGGE